MPEWRAFVDMDYYPYVFTIDHPDTGLPLGEVFAASTAEQAAEFVRAIDRLRPVDRVLVCPADAVYVDG